MDWRKSSYSGANGGSCVEVADAARVVLVRDTKDRDGPTLAFSAEAWRAFAEQLKRRLAPEEPACPAHANLRRSERGKRGVSLMSLLVWVFATSYCCTWPRGSEVFIIQSIGTAPDGLGVPSADKMHVFRSVPQ